MLIYEDTLRDRIRILRESGYTYSEIQEKINRRIPKGSMSYICKDIELSEAVKKRISGLSRRSTEKARRLAVIANKRIRTAMLEEMRLSNNHFSKLSDREAKIALVYLYLGEGGKWPARSGLRLGSSDARIIRTYIYLLKRCYGIKTESMKCQIAHRYDQNLDDLIEYWSKVTGVRTENFYRNIPDPRTKGKPTKKPGYMGVCNVGCPSSKNQLELDIIADIIDVAVRGIGAVG